MRHPRIVSAIAGLMLCLTLAGAAIAQDPPRVRLVATGGTISNREGRRLSADELVGLVPDVRRYARPEAEQFSNTSSSELTLTQWLALARRVNQLFSADRDLGGIVVTSGTDTLEELAYFLHLTVRDARPVVVTGSMRNPSTVGYEGPANLLEAFRVAASPGARGQGVLVVLNDEINSARDVTKTDALRLQTFQSRSGGVLGVVDADRVVFYRSVVKRHTVRSEFDLSAIAGLPRVDVLLVYQDAPGDLVRAAVDLGAQGLVIAVAGAGATSGTQSDGLAYAIGKGVTVVAATRTGSGRISGARLFGPPPGPPQSSGPATGARPAAANQAGQAAPRRARAAFIGGEDLTPIKARVLLMLALATTKDPAQVQRMFLEY
jgi:L-asparaginase